MNKPLFLNSLPASASLQALISARTPIFIIQRPQGQQAMPQPAPAEETQFPRRKRDSSLKHICLKLLTEYVDKSEVEIHLNEFSVKTGVERRRIYDIVNILEGFDVFVKKEKNVYVWKGIDVFIAKLKVIEALIYEEHKDLKVFRFEKSPITSKKKSLTYLSIKFLKSFCTMGKGLGFKTVVKRFADQLNENKRGSQNEFEDKNVVRRLYDIVNVFKALGLISKQATDSGKLDFCWQGSSGMAAQLTALKPSKTGEVARAKEQETPQSVEVVEPIEQKILAEITRNTMVNSDCYQLRTSGFRVVKGCQAFDPIKFRMAVFTKSGRNNLF